MRLSHRDKAIGCHPSHCRTAYIVLAVSWLAVPATLRAEPFPVRGLTEPYVVVDVACSESGILDELAVSEGQAVRRGQVLGTLHSDADRLMLAIAQQQMEAQGRLRSALAERELHRKRVENFEAVLASGHARQEEVERARADLAVAEAQVVTIQEELALRKLEYEKMKARLAQRTIRAPMDGVVAEIHKRPGEYVAPHDPAVLKLVQLDRLYAVCSVTGDIVQGLRVGRSAWVRLPDAEQPVKATIDFIAPVADAESGTVLVKLLIDNPTGRYRSGVRCSIAFSQSEPPMVEASVAAHRSGARRSENRLGSFDRAAQ